MAIHDIPTGKVVGGEALTVDSTTAEDSLTAAKYELAAGYATKAFITVAGDAILYTLDGTDPNGADGVHPAAVGDVIILRGIELLQGFRAVKVTNNATLRVSYVR